MIFPHQICTRKVFTQGLKMAEQPKQKIKIPTIISVTLLSESNGAVFCPPRHNPITSSYFFCPIRNVWNAFKCQTSKLFYQLPMNYAVFAMELVGNLTLFYLAISLCSQKSSYIYTGAIFLEPKIFLPLHNGFEFVALSHRAFLACLVY